MPEVRKLNPLTKAVLLGFALLLFGLVFREIVTLLIAVLVTALIAIPLAATATYLERFRIPRALGALVGLLIGVAAVAALLALVIPPFADQTEAFVAEVPGVVDSLEGEADDLAGASGEGTGTDIQEFFERYTDDPTRLIGPLASVGLGVAGILGAMLLVLITAYYVAIRPEPLVEGIASLVPPQRREWARGVMDRIRAAWIGWMQGVLFDMVLSGILLYVGLSLIGLEFAIFFAVFSALLVVVPYFGAIAGAIPPTLFALTDSPEKAALALGIYVLVQQVESNLTIPLVMANRVRLHPAVVAVGVVVVGQLFGFAGLLVAVPILSLVVILIDELWVKPLEADLGLRPAPASGVDLAAEAQDAPPDAERALILPEGGEAPTARP